MMTRLDFANEYEKILESSSFQKIRDSPEYLEGKEIVERIRNDFINNQKPLSEKNEKKFHKALVKAKKLVN